MSRPHPTPGRNTWPRPNGSALGLVEDRPRRLSAEQAVAAAATFFGWSPRTGSAPARLVADLYRLRDSGALTGWPDKLEPAEAS